MHIVRFKLEKRHLCKYLEQSIPSLPKNSSPDKHLESPFLLLINAILFQIESTGKYCHLSGTLDFQKITRKIEQVFCNGSRITRVVNLHNLPAFIRKMHVGERCIENASLRVGAFPLSDIIVNLIRTPKGIRFIFNNETDERSCKFTK